MNQPFYGKPACVAAMSSMTLAFKAEKTLAAIGSLVKSFPFCRGNHGTAVPMVCFSPVKRNGRCAAFFAARASRYHNI